MAKGDEKDGGTATLTERDLALVAATVAAVHGADPLREDRLRDMQLARAQEIARAQIPPIAEVVEAGSQAGDVLIAAKLRVNYSHRVGGSPDNVERGPKTLRIPFREAWTASAMFPERGNTARWDNAGEIFATVRALAARRAQAELAYAQGTRRTPPAEMRFTLAPRSQIAPKEREIPEPARW